MPCLARCRRGASVCHRLAKSIGRYPSRPAAPRAADRSRTSDLAPVKLGPDHRDAARASGAGDFGVGIPASRDGLPRTLWGASRSADLARSLAAVPADTLPAIRRLLYAILLAELAAPSDAGDPQETLFLARVDKLLDLGALDPALALLEQIDKPKPETFRRWFDISLLLGHENYGLRSDGPVARDCADLSGPYLLPCPPRRLERCCPCASHRAHAGHH